jgi:PAS domain S-box-containing protein
LSQPEFSSDPLVAQTSDPAFVIDPLEDRFVDANTAGCDLLGHTREELLDTPVSRIHPGELEQLRGFVSRVLEQGYGSTVTLACRIRQGDRLPIELSLWAFESAGRIRLLALVDERSEHRRRRVGH